MKYHFYNQNTQVIKRLNSQAIHRPARVIMSKRLSHSSVKLSSNVPSDLSSHSPPKVPLMENEFKGDFINTKIELKYICKD